MEWCGRVGSQDQCRGGWGVLLSLQMQGKSTSGAREDLMLPVNSAAVLVISSVCRRRQCLK